MRARSPLSLLAAIGLLASAACVEAPTAEEMNALDVCVVANDGDLCDDHQACTYPDRCLGKKCVGTPVADGTPCTDGNVCTTSDRCVAAVCVGTMLADGTSCTDGDPCTDPDVCQTGICQPGPALVCDDGDACTVDTCQAGVGCVFSARECTAPVDAPVDTTPDVAVDLAADVLSDAVTDLAGDAPSPDAGDAPADVGVPDGGGGDVVDGPTGSDAVDRGAGDTGDADAGADGALDLVETPPDLRVRGGGCQCALGVVTGSAEAGAPPTPLGVTLALGALALRRRRPRRPSGR